MAALETPVTPGCYVLDVVLTTARELSKSEIELQIVDWWATWHARNRFLFKGKKLDHLISAAKAKAVID